MLIDLHVHTSLSSDSSVAPEQYLETAARGPRRLDAICFTEHRLFPADPALDRRYAELSERYGIAVFKGIEADTNLGHLLLFGVTREVMRRFDLSARMLKSDALIEVMHGEGGIAVPAHPFRDSGFGARLDELLARHGPALSVIEALNGQNSPRENDDSLTAMEKLGLVGVGGSDAHFVTPKWFLTCATELERAVGTVEELCAELRAGRARPYRFDGAGLSPG
ncbi:MAG TPA: PHP-associated domain-containing protein [Candidatus Binataceae bacterium]|nr:PHP-associated domain-containing protein [Candidatus Binataceae bacterium]